MINRVRLKERGGSLPPLLPQGCQTTEAGLSPFGPHPWQALSRTLASPPSIAYVTSGPSVPAGEQPFLLNF